MRFTSSRHWKALNWPNRISIIRLLLVPPLVMLLLNLQDIPWARHAALGIFAVMAFSDFLDGTIARRYNIKTRLGAILDPLADKILIICSIVLLSLPDYAPPEFHFPAWVAVAVVGKDLWVIIGTLVVYLVTDRLAIAPTISGKASTVVQLLTVLLVLLVPDIEAMRKGLGVLMASVMSIVVAALSALAVVSYTRLGLVFIAEHQKPLDDARQSGPKEQ